jgi:hypothetical protein
MNGPDLLAGAACLVFLLAMLAALVGLFVTVTGGRR